MIAEVGLIILCLGWAFQLFYSLDGKNKGVRKEFLFLYCLGVLFLMYDSFSSGLFGLALLNFISFGLSIVLLMRVSRKN